jgi:hypothetical protein
MIYCHLKFDIMTADATNASPHLQQTPFSIPSRLLIDTAPIRIAPNPFAPHTNQPSNRRKTSNFDKFPGFSVFTNHQSPLTNHRASNRNCPELEIAITPSPSSKLDFLIATAKGGNRGQETRNSYREESERWKAVGEGSKLGLPSAGSGDLEAAYERKRLSGGGLCGAGKPDQAHIGHRGQSQNMLDHRVLHLAIEAN